MVLKGTLAGLLAGVAVAAAQIPLESARGSIQGIVINESGERLADATVWGYPAEDFRTQNRVETDAQGSFVLERVPAGLFYLDAFKESDFYPYKFFAFFNNTETGQNLYQVNVEAGRRAEGVVIQLGPKAASLTLEITQLDGTPLRPGVADRIGAPSPPGATVRFTRDNVPGVFSTAASSPHHTMLVPAVPFHFSVEAAGYGTWNSGVITPHSGETLTVKVRLIPQQLPQN